MDRSAAAAYVYAKASGMLAKSFTGSHAALLFEKKSLQELWTLVFNTEVPLVPEKLLARRIERAAEERFVSDYITLLNCYDSPDEVAVTLLRSFEFDNLKDLSSAVLAGVSSIPYYTDLKQYSRINYSKWPDIAAMTAGTPLSWYNTVPSRHEQGKQDLLLDREYVQELWRAASALPASGRNAVTDFIKEELILQNYVWALRLRVYYKMDTAGIPRFLASAGTDVSESDVLAGPAVKSLAWPADTYEMWGKWKYAHLLNPHEEGDVWSPDPRFLQQACNVLMYKKAHTLFRTCASPAAVLVAWFKIKQYELNCIRTAAEGIRLEADGQLLKEFIETGI